MFLRGCGCVYHGLRLQREYTGDNGRANARVLLPLMPSHRGIHGKDLTDRVPPWSTRCVSLS